MHILFRESHGLEESAPPRDLLQDPAEMVVLSFSDSDLGAFAAGWHAAAAAGEPLPALRLANLAELAHPLSVDTYVDRTLAGARAILIRLIGGRSYWSYGLQQVAALARIQGIALAVLAADGREDRALAEAATLPPRTLARLAALCDAGGPVAARAALTEIAIAAGLRAGTAPFVREVAPVGAWAAAEGVCCPAALAFRPDARPRVLLPFYRSFLLAADLHPVAALAAALDARGFDAIPLFAPSLKDAEARGWLARWVAGLAPVAIVNTTAFSAQGGDGDTSPLDATEVPVFQVALATSTRDAWQQSPHGLSPADLAMHVVLPEIDGRLFAGVASFKEAKAPDPALQYARRAHRADPARIGAIADRVAATVALARAAPADRRLALILSTYPGKAHQMAHAVGLDALASADAILADLHAAGYAAKPGAPLAVDLARERLAWPLPDYQAALAHLPASLRRDLVDAWGDPADDPAVENGAFGFAAVLRGDTLVALQPERGLPAGRAEDYHDLSRVPRHAYVAFHLWLRARKLHAVVHVGAHGTLEWLPGKSIALSDDCWPEALTGVLPVLYPFIVNDPGEAAQAKRRIGAVTLGHLPPPLVAANTGAGLNRLEALLDEFSTADGLDPARRDRLRTDIAEEAAATGLAAELGLASAGVEAIARLDAFVCDIKESRFGDGLHVYGRGPCGTAERDGLLAGLAGRRVPPGPAGSPHRGRRDVLPTGRNLFAVDPRAVPSRSAHGQGRRLAEELIRRHLQDHGDFPHGLVVDLWGSATMRTAGEEFAMALHLLGAAPVWDDASDRVTGVEILPLALLDRPRIDVTLRISGLFRDTFAPLCALFGTAVRALGARDEPPDRNPFAGRPVASRVYGPAPGRYGLGLGGAADHYTADARIAAGDAWLAGSSFTFDGENGRFDPAGIRARVAAADAFVHPQDLPETDLLLAADYAAHEAGFAAAQAVAGGSAALYHLDARDPDRPRARLLREEIARVVRARAANPAWISGMMRHGFRGAAEIAATLDHLGAFAHLARVVSPGLIDLYHDATLGRDEVRAFLAAENPGALAAMEARFTALHRSGLWPTRRNSILATLA